jgi:hypothetical protein
MELILHSLRLVMSMIPPISLKEVTMAIDSDKDLDLQEEDTHGGHLQLQARLLHRAGLQRAGLIIAHPHMTMRRRTVPKYTMLNSPGVNMKT